MKKVSDLFYLPSENIRENQVIFSAPESDHINRSCRMGVGDVVHATDGRGSRMAVEIYETGERLKGRVLKLERLSPEPCVIDLAVGISKRDRMSWLVEKGTELGMRSLTPLVTSWSRAQRPRESWESHVERWKRVSVAALKQSQRCFLPEIMPPIDIDDFIVRSGSDDHELRVLLDMREESPPLTSLLERGMTRFLVLLGPEGGFDGSEVCRIEKAGFLRGRLVRRRLRFETAGICAIALLATWVDEQLS